MYDKDLVKQLNDELSMIETEEIKVANTFSEATKIDTKIAELKEKMRIFPSLEVTQELGNLENGKQFFDESVKKFQMNYQNALSSHYKKAKKIADQLVNDSTKQDKEILSKKKKLYEAINSVVTLNDELEAIHDEKRQEALGVISQTKLSHYASEIGEYYAAPIEYVNLNSLPRKLYDSLKRELRD